MKITGASPTVLGIQKWSAPRIVLDQTFNSTGDGTISAAITTLPGKLAIDSGVLSWTSDSPLPLSIRIVVNRAYRDLVNSNPNAIQVRDVWNYAVSGNTPRAPDPTSLFNSQWGGSQDLGTNSSAVPYLGLTYLATDPQMTEDWYPGLVAGDTFKMWYRAYIWTPPPFSNNANNGTLTMSCNIRSTRIQLWAFPTQDTAVVSG
jgi:hypothetical protein